MMQQCRETVSGRGCENLTKQQQDEIQTLGKEKRQQILRDAGMQIEVAADEG